MRRRLHYTPAEVDAMDRLEIRFWLEMLQDEIAQESGGESSGTPSGNGTNGTQSDTKVYDLRGDADEATQAEIMQRLGI